MTLDDKIKAFLSVNSGYGSGYGSGSGYGIKRFNRETVYRIDGVKNPGECKFTVIVPEMTILGVIEIIPANEAAVKSIEEVKPWKR